jgi:hypothetical protein
MDRASYQMLIPEMTRLHDNLEVRSGLASARTRAQLRTG